MVPLFRSAFRVGDPVIPRAVGQLSLRYMYVHSYSVDVVIQSRPSEYTFTSNNAYICNSNNKLMGAPASRRVASPKQPDGSYTR